MYIILYTYLECKRELQITIVILGAMQYTLRVGGNNDRKS
jgi:hypothetical protein